MLSDYFKQFLREDKSEKQMKLIQKMAETRKSVSEAMGSHRE